MKDSFLTISASSNGLFKDRGSKFLAFAYPVISEGQVKDILDSVRKEYHDARHHCYAYRLEPDGSVWRANDDGEPGNSAGKPILNQIVSRNLTGVLVVVVRYFGGTLLGVPGLINAYRSAASDALDRAKMTRKYITRSGTLTFPYEVMDKIMRMVDDLEIELVSREFTEQCTMNIRIRASRFSRLITQLETLECHAEFE